MGRGRSGALITVIIVPGGKRCRQAGQCVVERRRRTSPRSKGRDMSLKTTILPEELTEEFQRNHDNWDYEHPEVHHAVREPRAVFSIRLTRSELDTVGVAAEAAGITTSAFIRNAAIAAAKGESVAQLHAAVAELREAVERANAALRVIEANESAASERLAG